MILLAFRVYPLQSRSRSFRFLGLWSNRWRFTLLNCLVNFQAHLHCPCFHHKKWLVLLMPLTLLSSLSVLLMLSIFSLRRFSRFRNLENFSRFEQNLQFLRLLFPWVLLVLMCQMAKIPFAMMLLLSSFLSYYLVNQLLLESVTLLKL